MFTAVMRTTSSNDAAMFAPSASCANHTSAIVIIMDTVILAVSIFVSVLVLLGDLLGISLLILVLLITLLLGSISAKKRTGNFLLQLLQLSAAA